MLLDGLHRGLHGGTDETFLVVACPIIGRLARDIRLVDDGRHMTLPEIVGFLRLFEIRPIVRELEEAAELVEDAFRISGSRPEERELILEVVS